jgi:hypothetical protein
MTSSTCPWSGFESSIMSFCEQRLCSWVVEPANTWSNIGYVMVGLLILRSNAGTGRAVLMLPALTAILVGFASASFHATGTRIGEMIDLSAMYLISSLFIAFNVWRVFGWSQKQLAALYAGICGVSIWSLSAFQTSGIRLFAAHLTVAAILEAFAWRKSGKRTHYRYLGFLCGAFAFAFAAWLLDVKKIVCWPDNHVLGGHAVWHLSNSTCLYWFYRFQEQFFDKRQI